VSFARVLESGAFVVTAELGPPLDPDPELVRRSAQALAGHVHAVNVTDNQAATVKLSPLACVGWMMDEGVVPILQLTTRDRNLLALQADLLGAYALGVRAVMALSGDPLKVGPYESLSKPVSDFDSIGLIRLVAQLNEGRLAAGERLRSPTAFSIIGAANPLVDSIAKLEQKIDAGVQCFQTSIVYDVAGSPSGSSLSWRPAYPSRHHCSSGSLPRAARACLSTCTTTSPASRSTRRRSAERRD
jgi:5,10-methylenetetrahydrofolate reductase